MKPDHYPLSWPTGLPRAKARAPSPFKVKLDRAIADLRDALRLFGTDTGKPITDVVISSNVTLGDTRPADPGVAVYFMWDGARRCVAVDRYAKVEDNVRAIYYVLEGRRQEMRYGGLEMVRAAFKGFSALPPPDGFGWRAVLGLDQAATLEEAEAAYRTLARGAHPDQPGGSQDAMAALNVAIQQARRELSA